MNDAVNTCSSCGVNLGEVDKNPNGTLDSVCVKCRAEEKHDYDAEPNAVFDRNGERVVSGRCENCQHLRRNDAFPNGICVILEDDPEAVGCDDCSGFKPKRCKVKIAMPFAPRKPKVNTEAKPVQLTEQELLKAINSIPIGESAEEMQHQFNA